MTLAEYVITDGTRYIYKNHNNRYVPISNEVLADVFTRKQADTIYKHSLSRALKKVFYIKMVDPERFGSAQNKPGTVKKIEFVKTQDYVKEWLDKISDLNGLVKAVSNRKEELLFQLSNLDKELCDVEHYIEFSTLNAAQGYNAYKMIKERRIKRRSVKNELAVLEIILDSKIQEGVVETINKRVAGLDNMKYKPRVLTELFNS